MGLVCNKYTKSRNIKFFSFFFKLQHLIKKSYKILYKKIIFFNEKSENVCINIIYFRRLNYKKKLISPFTNIFIYIYIKYKQCSKRCVSIHISLKINQLVIFQVSWNQRCTIFLVPTSFA